MPPDRLRTVSLTLSLVCAPWLVPGAAARAQPIARPVAAARAPHDLRATPTAPAAVAPTAGAPVLDGRVAALGAAFAGVGVLAARADRALADRLQAEALQAHPGLRRGAVVFRRLAEPGAVLALPIVWAIGSAAGDRDVAAVGLRGTESIALALGTVGIVKLVAGRARPSVPGRDPGRWRLADGLRNGSEFRSFPSGHTATAFAAATAVTAEVAARRPGTRWAVGVPLHALAAGAGWSRMFENRHWASDVVGGAAVGTLSALLVSRWHRAHPGSAFDRRLLPAASAPSGPR